MAGNSDKKPKGLKRRALYVGINQYPYTGNDLNGCVNDAKAWAKTLILPPATKTPSNLHKPLIKNNRKQENFRRGFKRIENDYLATAH